MITTNIDNAYNMRKIIQSEIDYFYNNLLNQVKKYMDIYINKDHNYVPFIFFNNYLLHFENGLDIKKLKKKCMQNGYSGDNIIFKNRKYKKEYIGGYDIHSKSVWGDKQLVLIILKEFANWLNNIEIDIDGIYEEIDEYNSICEITKEIL